MHCLHGCGSASLTTMALRCEIELYRWQRSLTQPIYIHLYTVCVIRFILGLEKPLIMNGHGPFHQQARGKPA